MTQNFHNDVSHALLASNITAKLEALAHLHQYWHGKPKAITASTFTDLEQPGRPERPTLVQPRELKHRKLTIPEGVAAMVHAIAHIEFNAINLALDALYRFRDLPADFYDDWLQVAYEESQHFILLSNFLGTIDHQYGDFPAHNGLWELALATKEDVLLRMAIVPRVMEARGLDVTPGISAKFAQIGCQEMVDILTVIFREEIGHVRLGNKWFHAICTARKLDPLVVFRELAAEYLMGQVKLPFHEEARLKAGFSEAELELLAEIASGR